MNAKGVFKGVTVSLMLTVLGGWSFPARGATVLGWNNLGMHCMDSDYSVFSILPPYNTIEAQVIVNGRLVTNGTGYSVTYQAVADPSGSINKTSAGKGNWLENAPLLYGGVAADQGLAFPGPASFWMPGTNNTPQAMMFEATNEPAGGVLTPVNWFHAYGIPITPYDDAHNKNPYPMMRLIARSGTTPIATNDIVLPVSDEMDCRLCHASGSVAAAQPAAGWVWDGIQERDFRLNILRLHDEHNFASNSVLYTAALAAKGFNPQGLYRGVVADHQPVLCAACHASEALAAPSYGTIPPLTTSVHGFHAHVIDPLNGNTLDSVANRSACYRCHPGSTTRCLRGAMGGAIATDGSMAMQCQSCHGNLSTVGAPDRVGWFMEPNCASCHTGSATTNRGQIRYSSVYTDTNFTVRGVSNLLFSTQPNIPVGGISLYRFSAGHGGLQCSACHGSTHAEFPSTHANDNVRNQNLQGHVGVMVECLACHTSMTPSTNNIRSGPHGLHPLGATWVERHPDLARQTPGGVGQCRDCHGTNYRGSVLGRAQADRTFTTKFGTKTYWRGKQIGCYDCHNGYNSSDPSANTPATVSNVSTNTLNSATVRMVLPGTDPNGNPLTFRIVAQPANGSVGVSNNVATYFPNEGFVGTDTFTFAANDTYTDSNLGTGTVAVVQGPIGLGAVARVPASYPAGWSAPFAVVPAVTNSTGVVAFKWSFGDGATTDTNQFPTHIYSQPGTYAWAVVSTLANQSVTNRGNITISSPLNPFLHPASGTIRIDWPVTAADVVLEQTDTLGTNNVWVPVTNAGSLNLGQWSITLPATNHKFFRVRRAW